MSKSRSLSRAALGLLPLFLLAGLASGEDRMVFRDPKAPAEKRVEDLLGRLTVEEKIHLVHGRQESRETRFESGGIPRLGVGPLLVLDGPVGLRTFDETCTTALPSTLALSCTWDTEAAYAYGKLMGEEMLALKRHVLFGPGVDLMRSPLGARNFEYMGEDPFLCGSLAASYIRGVQSQGVAACAKHLVANDSDSQRHFTSSNMDDRTLRQIHMLPFEMAVRDGNVWSLMSANSLVNGVHIAENKVVLQDLVKDEIGFDGVMLTDWRAAYSAVPSALAGTDSTMGLCAYVFGDSRFADAVKSGQIPPSLLDDKVRRILRLYVRTGVLDPELRGRGALDTPEHRVLARRLAAEGAVLLKNERALLPLDPKHVRKVLVTGPGAEMVPFGRGSGAVRCALKISPLEGLVETFGDKEKIKTVSWPAPGGKGTKTRGAPKVNIEALRQAAADCEIAIFFATDPVHGEGNDLDSFDLPDGQAEAIEAIAASNRNTIVVLLTGEPVSLEPWIDHVPAVLEGWYAGQATGQAIADVLTGKVNPGGKLSCTMAKNLEDYACHALKVWPARLILEKAPGPAGMTARDRVATYAYAADYKEGVLSGYRWFQAKRVQPRFPFGFGMSYTTFEMSGLEVDSSSPALRISCTVRNTGAVPGAEVVQVYVSDPETTLVRELKGFTKVRLNPGEARQVQLTLRPTALAGYDPASKAWRTVQGDYMIFVGASAVDLPLRAPITIKKPTQFEHF